MYLPLRFTNPFPLLVRMLKLIIIFNWYHLIHPNKIKKGFSNCITCIWNMSHLWGNIMSAIAQTSAPLLIWARAGFQLKSALSCSFDQHADCLLFASFDASSLSDPNSFALPSFWSTIYAKEWAIRWSISPLLKGDLALVLIMCFLSNRSSSAAALLVLCFVFLLLNLSSYWGGEFSFFGLGTSNERNNLKLNNSSS